MKTAETTEKTIAKTAAGDDVVLVPGLYSEVCSARCEGCGWTDPKPGWVADKAPVLRAARSHARECIGTQGALF